MKKQSVAYVAAALATVFVMASGAFAQQLTSYMITGSGTSFTATKRGVAVATGPFQTVLNAIRDDVNCSGAVAPAAGCGSIALFDADGNDVAIQFGNGTDDPNGNGVAIQFGDGTNVLDIGTAGAWFGNVGGQRWGRINLSGKITSAMGIPATGDGSSGTVFIGSGVFVESSADIANTAHNGNAICVDGGGTVRISGGTVSSAGGFAVQIPLGRVAASVILTGSPTITGTMNVTVGALSVELFSPAEKQYKLSLNKGGSALAEGDGAVAGGANFISNFTLVTNGNLALKASGDNLVLYDPTASIITKNTVSAKRLGISQNGANLRIVGATQATNIRIYDLNGKLLLSRSAMPNEVISVSNLARGTYVVKAMGKSVRLVR
jgi:hypothetical protein